MKKLIMMFLILSSAAALAERIPTIIGHVKSQAKGEITFTTEKGSCADGTNLAYIQKAGGEIYLLGCWRKIGSKIFVTWSDGDVFSYDTEFINFTEEWIEYANQ